MHVAFQLYQKKIFQQAGEIFNQFYFIFLNAAPELEPQI